MVLRTHHRAQGALLDGDPERRPVCRDDDGEVAFLPLLSQSRRGGAALGVLREVELAIGNDKEGDRVPLVHGLNLTGLADQAFLVRVFHADHVPVAVQRVRCQRRLLGAEHPAVVARPIPEVRLQPPRHGIRGVARLYLPHQLVEHRLVRLRSHVVTVSFCELASSAQVDPGGLGRHAAGADREQHVPAGRPDPRIRRQLQAYLARAGGLVREVH